jgi:receptor protein-tyrosine kinase
MSQSDRGFDFLRVSLESRIHVPCVVAVTSAQHGDGASVVAAGLAESFSLAGQATLLISAQAQQPAYPRGSSVASFQARGAEGRSALTRATADQVTADIPGGRSALPRAFANLRESFAVVIVDTEPITESSFAYELASAADGVLVAIRLGRRSCADDQKAIGLLDACGANVLGLVPTKSTVPALALAKVGLAGGDSLPIRSQAVEATR